MMMISPDSIPSKPVATDPNQSSSSGSRKSSGAQRPPDHQQALKCPRCDSPNTKFCYYNNYSLTQPRHFCKTCRRYWTKGGALRNVPIGGGCRKNKKTKTGSRQYSSDGSYRDLSAGCYDTSGLKFFHGFTTAMEFQLGRLPFISTLNYSSTPATVYYNQSGDRDHLSSSAPYTTTAPPCLNMDASPSSSSLMGFHDYPVTSGGGVNWGAPEIGSMNVHNSLASSIESLSSINQDLHWKLQQQRLAMFFGGEKQEISSVSSVSGSLLEKPQSILFQNLEIPKPESCAVVINQRKSGIIDGIDSTGAHDQWFFENSNNIPGATPANSSNNNGNEHTSNWSGIQAWSDMNQYSALPQ